MGGLRLCLVGTRSPADGRPAPQEAEEPRGGPECPRQEEGADDGAGAAGGGAGGGGEGLGETRGWGSGRSGAASLPHGSSQNKKLLRENQLLRERTCNLARENQELRCRLGFDALKTEEEEEGEEFQVSPAAAVSAPALGRAAPLPGQPWCRGQGYAGNTFVLHMEADLKLNMCQVEMGATGNVGGGKLISSRLF